MKKLLFMIGMFLLSYIGMAQTLEFSGSGQTAKRSEANRESKANLRRKAYLEHKMKTGETEREALPRIRLLSKSKSGTDDATLILKVAKENSHLGYQMLLDSKADTYGTIIPSDEWASRLSTGDLAQEVFSRFGYTIPANASRILADSIATYPGTADTIRIQPGTYDFCITYPDFNRFRNGFWLAAGDWSRQDNYEFEKGYVYTFAVTQEGDTGFYPPLNLKAEKLELPEDGTLGKNEAIKIRINNVGTQDASGFRVSYQVNDGKEISEKVPAPIAAGKSSLYTFRTKADLSSPGLYTVKAWISWEKDLDNGNDTIVADVKHPTVTNLPLTEDFETETTIRTRWNLVDANSDGNTWKWEPYTSSDGGAGSLSYMRTSSAADADDYIISDPVFFPAGDLHVSLDYRTSYGAGAEVLEILYGTSINPLEMKLLTRVENINNTDWKKTAVNFEVREEGNYHLAFRVATPKESGYDLYIDAISADIGPYVGNPDLELVDLKLPASSCDIQDSRSLKAVVGNNGNEGIYAFTLILQIDNDKVITQDYSEYIAPGESKTVDIWSQDGDFSFPEKRNYVVTCRGVCEQDSEPANNEIILNLHHYDPITDLPFYSRFDNEDTASDWYTSDRKAWVYDPGYTTYENYEDSVPLVSRCVRLEPGSYRVNLRYSAGLSVLGIVAKENFLMSYGRSGTDPAGWEVFMDARDEFGKELTKEAIFKVSETGEYCLAIMTTEWGNLDMGLLSVFEINLERIPEHDLQLETFLPLTLPAQIPSAHLRGVHLFQATVLNRGTSVERQVKVEVRDENNWAATSEILGSLDPEESRSFHLQTEVPEWKEGDIVALHATASAVNEVNSAEFIYSFAVSDTVFARDKVTEYANGVGAKKPLSFGNVYTLMTTDTLTSLSVGFIDATQEIPVDIAVYPLDKNNRIGAALVRQRVIRPEREGTCTYALPVRLLEPGTYYFEISQKGDENILVACDAQESGSFCATSKDSLVNISGYGNILIRANFGHHALIYDYDIAVDKIIRPASNGVFKEKETITAVVVNNGYRRMENIPVHCSVNGQEIALKTIDSLEPYEGREISFTADLSKAGQYLIRVRAEAETDVNPENDASELTVTCQQRSTIYEMNFEECEDFAVSGFTPAWTVFDGDGADTERFQSYQFPHAGEPMSFIAFNPYQTDPSMELTPGILPHSGLRFGASFSARGVQNDDWLISPKLKLGDHSSMSLYVKTYVSNYGLETYQILVSETNNLPGSFTSIGDLRYSPHKAWEKVVVDLSAYDGKEVYVAVRCISENAFVFMVDDIRVSTIPTSIENTPGEPELKLFPNPVRQGEWITVEPAESIRSVSVYDTFGKLFYHTEPEPDCLRINTSAFEPGVYFIRIDGTSGGKSLKLLVTE